MQGFLNINKPYGVTSAYVVNKIKKNFKLNKVGHLGTLDPLATGVLPIAINKATRLFDYFLTKEKEYVATFAFGYETNTLDSDGEVVDTTNEIPTETEIKNKSKSFIGKYEQMPPNFSAKKVNGKKAYELARAGEEVILKPKLIEVFEFELLEVLLNNTYKFKISCSSGTYIRSLGKDLANSLKSLCTMTALVRTKSGYFDIKESINLDELLTKNTLLYDIISIKSVIDLNELIVTYEDFIKLKNGLTLITNETDGVYKVLNNDILLGIGEVQNSLLKLKTYLLNEN